MKKYIVGLALFMLMSTVIFAGDTQVLIYTCSISTTTATLIKGINKGRKEIRIKKNNDTYEMRIATYPITHLNAVSGKGYPLYTAGEEFRDNYYVVVSSWYVIITSDTVTSANVNVLEKQ